MSGPGGPHEGPAGGSHQGPPHGGHQGEAPGPGPEYKVVEVATVTDEELERVVNDWTARGWMFEGFQFAMRESSRRPSMAFVLFTRPRRNAG